MGTSGPPRGNVGLFSPSGAPLGAFLRLSWAVLRALLKASWAVLERSWGPLGPSWSVGKPKRRKLENLSNTYGI